MVALTAGTASAAGSGLQPLLDTTRVPGAAVAIVRDGTVDFLLGGVRSAAAPAPVTADTIFEAASLSKPVFAYAVLQLIDAGTLSLDTRLSTIVPDFVPDDARATAITVRHVLSHTTGLPNWRSAEFPLRAYFSPGERFSYSGEGFVWLQKVAETAARQPIDQLMTDLVFQPLGMGRSSFVWRPDLEENHAVPHDLQGSPGVKYKPAQMNAAASLQTTARDYARFVQAVLGAERLKPETARLWLAPQSVLRHDCVQCLKGDEAPRDMRLAWGLGWGVAPDDGTFFHWGDNGRFKALIIGTPRDRAAFVVFTNGENGMALVPALAQQLGATDHPLFGWLRYWR